MASYDSDSSGGEDQDFTETDVLLGYASKDSEGEIISRLGGRPDWLDPSLPPSAALARCKVCKDLMVLLLQLNGELPERFPGHERRLYVFSCRKRSCRRKEGSIRAVRGLNISPDAPAVSASKGPKVEEKKAAPAPTAAETGLGEALFGVKSLAAGSGRANPFSAAGSNPFAKPSGAAANPFSKPAPAKTQEDPKPAAEKPSETTDAAAGLPKTFAETLSLNNPQTPSGPPPPAEPWPQESDLPPAYPVSWLADAEYETLDPTPMPKYANPTPMDVDSSDAGGSGKEDKEVFESTMDATFQKFADRVGQNPDQCIRYEFGGQPLLYSKTDAVGKLLHVGGEDSKVTTTKSFPRCQNCTAPRTFEVQLTPHAIEELEADEDGLEGMDWGTIILAVCERDCQERDVKPGQAGYIEEWTGVQWEELTAQR
ncbi:hypothetical protein GQ53DRAFT_239200 [Thozetella sp. PMI_491]|nr:hypothetical protein GQ53DRAFT_239200 [Thozetella sp. PMI_491]